MSDDNVVTFGGNNSRAGEPGDEGNKKPAAEQYILVCSKCDNRTFNMYAGGKVECAFCEHEIHNTGGADDTDMRSWRRVVGDGPADPSTVPDSNPSETHVKQMTDVSLARRQQFKRIKEWNDDNTVVMMSGYSLHGEGRHWFDIRSEEQRAWVLEKLGEITDTVTTMEISMPLKLNTFPVGAPREIE